MSDSQAPAITGLVGVMGRLEDHTDGQRDLTVQHILDSFGNRAFGPILVILGLIVVSPIGAIPTVPSIIGLLLLLISVQQLIGRNRPWVPRRLRERGVARETMRRAFDKVRPWARRVDRVFKPRLTFLVKGAMIYVVATIVVGLAILMPPLEVLPFAAALPGVSVLLLGLALTARDGLVALIGLLLAASAAGLGVYVFVG